MCIRDRNDTSIGHSETEREHKAELELHLRRLGFYNSELPTPHDLETSYMLYKKTVEDSAIDLEDKKFKKSQLRSSIKHIYKVIQGKIPSPSSSDTETASSSSDT